MMRNYESGVTLIEILIAVSLLSLLSVGMLVALRLGFTTMDKTDSRLVMNRRVANSRQIIENEINGFVPAVALYHPAPEQTLTITLLQTEASQMRFVTTYSLDNAWRGRPQIAVLQVIPGDRNEGVRLIVNETPYTGGDSAGQQIASIEPDIATGRSIIHYREIPASSQSFVLADRLAYCRFSYLQPLPQPPFQVWRSDWILPGLLPQGVRIEMAPLDHKNGELRVSTVTLPFPVDRAPGVSYADYTPPPPPQ